MTEKSIQKALYRKFLSHRYKFANAFYFENESDFLTFLPSGFCYEFEIKISRSDFKADFKKIKHTIHENVSKKYYTVKGREVISREPCWDLCKNFPQLVTAIERSGYSYRMRNELKTDLSFCGYSSVEFREFKNDKLPNKFFYAVPRGLITKDDVPEYAGLIYINPDFSVEKIKDGKFIHKQQLPPERLWNKAYNAYENQLRNNLFS